jgi:predicted DNA-binding transcriptional regulator YafY
MYNPTSRVLTVLELLQSRPAISGTELAARLEVDARTVRRYILKLQDIGIPIEATMGRYGGYRLRAGFKLPPLMFTNEEVLALMLGLAMARRANIDSIAPSVEGVSAKIERVLPKELRQQVQAFQATHTINLKVTGSHVQKNVIELISSATSRCQQVWIHYRKESGEESERVIDPYGIVYYNERWYVPAYCHRSKEIRTFRLDRVLACRNENGTFTRPVHFHALQHLITSIRDIPDTWNVEVLLHATLEEVQRKVPETLAALEQQEQGIKLYAMIAELNMMAHFLVGLNVSFKVLQPVELCTALQRLAEELQRMMTSAT